MVEDLKYCDKNETDNIANYLLNSSVPTCGEALLRGQMILSKGIIKSLEDLGNFKTLTGEIPESAITGSKRPTPPKNKFDGEKKYLVNEQIPFMDGTDINDGGHIQKIKTYISQMGTKDQPKFIITAIHKDNDYMFVDGNKRSIAFYEYSKKREISDIDYQIYILELKIA